MYFSLAKCGGTQYISQDKVLTIKSPNYPGMYDLNMDCTWTLVGPRGHYLMFTFPDMNLPDSYNCSASDHLEILEQNVTSSELCKLKQRSNASQPFLQVPC